MTNGNVDISEFKGRPKSSKPLHSDRSVSCKIRVVYDGYCIYESNRQSLLFSGL
jgi:hypothetical protein